MAVVLIGLHDWFWLVCMAVGSDWSTWLVLIGLHGCGSDWSTWLWFWLVYMTGSDLSTWLWFWLVYMTGSDWSAWLLVLIGLHNWFWLVCMAVVLIGLHNWFWLVYMAVVLIGLNDWFWLVCMAVGSDLSTWLVLIGLHGCWFWLVYMPVPAALVTIFTLHILTAYLLIIFIAPVKALFFFQPKSTDIFLISPQKHMLWYSLEVPHWGTSNEYPQHMFLWRNKKNIFLIPPQIWSYDTSRKIWTTLYYFLMCFKLLDEWLSV